MAVSQADGAGGGAGVALRPHKGPSWGAYAVTAVLLGAAMVALLWVPSYAKLTPTVAGIPFFYWYSILWLLINAACQWLAYMLMVIAPRRRQEASR